ncbi:MAG: DUF4870 domain-containing protein [Yaniella sp.]|uniref:DUF4870 domain-containing protein n=1 Tax=Yaniella sp. TaxID=2773929 RepID=UPI0026474FF5|nr:DUF4870 domain-containing protein [Yaniella sp.]MDN5817424.1 DUF4870 domain-containing protein [Yaniella sp.]MDN6147820.1 DUF4870 domain-containing protein [Yaniella sp.]MDN6356947.1 DUF4870 domain-containing protein [Yaniella sp.]
MNPSNVSADDLNDPTIDAETLREIAVARPDLRGLILQHPNCHAELANFIQDLPQGIPSGYSGGQTYGGQPSYGYGAGPYAPYAPQPPVSVSDEKTWGVLMHIGSLFLGFLAPLIVWLIYRDRSQTLDQQGRTALNWQISAVIYAVVSSVLMFILVGFVTLFAVAVLDIVFCIIAAVKAGDREAWRYPLSIPFLRDSIEPRPQGGQYY